jgi:hypothetical protein
VHGGDKTGQLSVGDVLMRAVKASQWLGCFLSGRPGMFVVEVYAAVQRFVFVDRNSRREAAREFGPNRETVTKMCRFSPPPGYTRTIPVAN